MTSSTAATIIVVKVLILSWITYMSALNLDELHVGTNGEESREWSTR